MKCNNSSFVVRLLVFCTNPSKHADITSDKIEFSKEDVHHGTKRRTGSIKCTDVLYHQSPGTLSKIPFNSICADDSSTHEKGRRINSWFQRRPRT